ncbi:translation initiation factor IF-2 [Bradyrhizobium elkanii]|uniref:hypothetical protein n=1 Tax=Bradyrhizobium elkanii TaxID=29448 RepID=UPI00091411DD|nr:hypothetical protein [Bradyrhizobium elkanii]MCW2195023.1 translation initiation factor IF-2 [Bradyrhizobium elkanii]NWL67282.1 hypothetical protein [Bradyrhizobium elkanii]OIM94671.1 hypothetical protein BLN97_09375 [Bradyrhizobium elkanii]
MKISISPLVQEKKRAERRINTFLMVDGHDVAHARKHMLALSVQDGAAATAEFEEAARIEGKTAQELAAIILAKPDDLMIKENKRRSLLVAARNAQTLEELNKILEDNGVPAHYEDQRMALLP